MAKFDNYEKPPWVSTGPRTRMLRDKKKVRQQKIAQKRKEMSADSFEAPRKSVSASKRKKNTEISKIISDIMHTWEKTGKIGKNRPPTRKAAQKMAIAVAYSIYNRKNTKKAEEFNAPYAGSGALSGIGLSTDQLTSTWGSGDFDKSSLNSSGHMTVFANAEEDEPEYPCDYCGKPAKYNFQDSVIRWELIDGDFENPKVSEYSGQMQNDFYCEPCSKKYETSSYYKLASEEGNTPVQDPMEFGEMANWRPLDGTPGLSKRKRAESLYAVESWEMIECGNCDATFTIDEGLDIGGIDYCEECYDTISAKDDVETFEAPMGYNELGPQPFYGNPRKIAIDRWGNRRFIRRRRDGTYMKNVDVGRSIAMDRRRQSQTWAPPGFRDQGDGSPSLLERFRNRLRQ
jgi:hypothetical protein